jgi:hypothetical protein
MILAVGFFSLAPRQCPAYVENGERLCNKASDWQQGSNEVFWNSVKWQN